MPVPPEDDILFDDEPEDGDHVEEGDGLLFLDDPGPVVLVDCWRCGKSVEQGTPLCPFCRARLGPPNPALSASRKPKANDAGSGGLVTLLWLYAGFIGTSLAWGLFSRFGFANPNNAAEVDNLLRGMFVVEVIDAILVVVACFLIKPPASTWWKGPGRAALAWIGGFVLLAVLLLINVSYHLWLREFLRLPDIGDEIVAAKGLGPLVIGLICLQPAIVEELFFRYLALGHLRSHMGTHGAVFVSGVMFGLAHLGQPLGLPVLVLLGIGFGYARVWGGTLLLPMVMHFVHNLAVLILNQIL